MNTIYSTSSLEHKPHDATMWRVFSDLIFMFVIQRLFWIGLQAPMEHSGPDFERCAVRALRDELCAAEAILSVGRKGAGLEY